jgi:glycosyltransferase involved in cell wall biosynthesis
MRTVLIYRNELLPFSETFILSQISALRRFQPTFFGIRRVERSLDITRFPVFTLNSSAAIRDKITRRYYLRTGHANYLSAKIKTQDPAVIHAHFAVDACAVLPMVRRAKRPLIVTLHGYDVTCNESSLGRWPTTRAYLRRKSDLWQYTSRFLCVSEHIRQQALKKGFPEDKLSVHYTGVEIDPCIGQFERPPEGIVLFVGRFVEKKGCIHLIRAMAEVEKSSSHAMLVLVGDGPLKPFLEQEAARLLRRYLFVGRQSHSEVREWMRRASVAAVPSVRAEDGDTEGLPTVICEAQSLGRPVVAFGIAGVAEALPAELRNRLPVEGDEGGLAETIRLFLEDDEAWRYASRLGRRFVEERFDIHTQTFHLESLYDKAIAEFNG